MFKRRNIMPIFAICLLILFFLNYRTPSSEKSSNKVDSDVTPDVSTPSSGDRSLSERAKEFAGLDKPHLTADENKSECKQALESIETVPLNTLAYDLENNRLKLEGSCLMQTIKPVGNLVGFPEVCSTLTNGKVSENCLKALFIYKAIRIENATANDSVENLPTEMLANKYIGLLSRIEFENSENIQRLRTIGQELYHRLPNSETAYKSAVIGYLGDNLNSNDSNHIDQLLKEGREKFPTNWEIYEIDLMRIKQRNPAAAKKEILDYYQKFPNSALAIYYMGCNSWSEAQVPTAQNFFKRATEKSTDPRMQDTYQKSLTLKPPAKVCSIQININPAEL